MTSKRLLPKEPAVATEDLGVAFRSVPFTCETDWPVVQLRDICKKIGSGATPTGGRKAYQSDRTNFALVRSQNVFDRSFSSDGLAFISDDQARALKNVELYPDDLLLNITGDGVTFGRACMVPQPILPACVNQHVSIVRVDRSKAHPAYVLAYLNHPSVKNYMEGFNTGGSRRALTKGHIESFLIALPSLEQQQRVGEMLMLLDSRIEIVRQANETLETMARAVFKSWFVDFDPVRAKAEGREPEGMDAATAALFPSELQDSELGPIPRGWSVGRFDSLVEIVKDSLNPLKCPEAIFELFSLPGFDEGRRASLQTGSEIKSNKTIVPEGAVLLSKLNPSIERVWAPSLSGAHRSVCSTEFLVLRGQAHVSTGFVYCLARSSDFREMLLSLTTGTSNSHQRVRVPDLQASLIVMPEVSVHTAFAQIANPLLQRVNNNLCLIQTLANLRDILLPRLISGKLRVPEAEAVLAEAL